MWNPPLRRSTLFVLSGSLAFFTVACDNIPNPFAQAESPTPTPSLTPSSNKKVKKSVTQVSPSPKPAPDTYEQALDAATSAKTIAKSAESQDDWKLVVNRWDDAIKLFKAVPASSPNKAKAQKNLTESEPEVAYAKLHATPPKKLYKFPATIATKQPFFKAPIKYRVSGIPVIEVSFNGGKKVEMLFDTGASHTLITPQLASALSLEAVGMSRSSTANGVADFFVAFVNSMEVGGAVAKNVPVGIGAPDLGLGLFGQDFYRGYDVSVKQNVIEFRRR